ncbi:MAG TPA: VWA domain-containing protein [Terriglobales bacterium]|nr:VWA domain-containing protein [Terriglobales bacterium]
MLRNRLLLCLGLLTISTVTLLLYAQQSDTQVTPVIRVTTRLVMVDVIAVDKSGNPVTDLKPEDFVLEEGGKKQKISVFGLHKTMSPAAPALPPNIYSNRPETQPLRGAVTILLVDGLNSPFQNQAYVRQKLIEYVKTQHKPGQYMAVLALGNGLYKLQGFTTDPELLRQALENWRPESARETATTPVEVRLGSVPPEAIGARGVQVRESNTLQRLRFALDHFQQEEAVTALEVRMGITLESLRAIGRMVAGMPGRKNLVWVSAAFPFTLTPEDASVTYTPTRANDPTAPPPIAEENTAFAYSQQLRQGRVDEIRRTAALLADSQVAVYPVDARGLIGAQQLADASRSGLNAAGMLQMGHEYGTQVQSLGASITSNQGVMQDLAQQTGGRAYYNRNDIDNAVALVASDGSAYYNLGYYPDKKKFDGSFRKIKVTVSRPGVELRYRRGYYAVDPMKIDAKQRDAEMQALMLRGSGDATMVTFDARVVPPLTPAAQAKVTIQFLVPANSFSSEETSGGRRINLDFFVTALTPDGKVGANTGQTVDATLAPDQFAQVQQQGLMLPMEVTVPAGVYDLRLAVRDNRTGYFGTLSAPLTVRRPGS